ncbi:hypothetical protein V5O48_007253 [Marasmius crinis-equi]|uniref:Uncharacterized protein n=1 Tax=Marasmius crinis-equi TaxID=585013 RepID=A0ABR3FH90_9AGAR
MDTTEVNLLHRLKMMGSPKHEVDVEGAVASGVANEADSVVDSVVLTEAASEAATEAVTAVVSEVVGEEENGEEMGKVAVEGVAVAVGEETEAVHPIPTLPLHSFCEHGFAGWSNNPLVLHTIILV